MRYDNVRLHKEMYNEGELSQVLEARDPNDQYYGTSMEGLDAFQRQLKRFDIKVRGSGSDTVEKFFKTAESTVLFPEFAARAVKQGLDEATVLPSIAATITEIEGKDYRSITSSTNETDGKDKLPASNISIDPELTRINQQGRMLVGSYEALRFQRIDLFSVALRQIGALIAHTQMSNAVSVLLDARAANIFSTKDIALDHGGILEFGSKFDVYEMNTLLVSNDVMFKLLTTPEFGNIEGITYNKGGFCPLTGARIIRSAALPLNTLIGLDKRFALEMVQVKGIHVEHEKLINRQFERAVISTSTGFSKIYKDAVKVLRT